MSVDCMVGMIDSGISIHGISVDLWLVDGMWVPFILVLVSWYMQVSGLCVCTLGPGVIIAYVWQWILVLTQSVLVFVNMVNIMYVRCMVGMVDSGISIHDISVDCMVGTVILGLVHMVFVYQWIVWLAWLYKIYVRQWICTVGPYIINVVHAYQWTGCLVLGFYVGMHIRCRWILSITKTYLFKFIENFTTKKWKFSDKNFCIPL